MNKSKIIWAFVFLFSASVIQCIAFNISSKLSVNNFCVMSMSSALPFAVSVSVFSSLIQHKYKIFKFILNIFATLSIILFVVGCVIALTIGFVLVGGKYVPNW